MEHIGKNSSRAGAKQAITAEQAANSAHHAIDQLSAVARPAVWRTASSAHQMVDRIGEYHRPGGTPAGTHRDPAERPSVTRSR